MPPVPEDRKPKEPVGPIVGTVIILILMVVGAVYFWYQRQTPNANVIPYIPASSSTTTGE